MIKTINYKGKKYKIKIDEDLAWFAPYLTKAARLGLPIYRIKEVVGYYVPETKQERQLAAIHDLGHGKYKITIVKWRQQWKRTRKGSSFEVSGWVRCDQQHYFESTIESLAHEISHMLHWEHTADRWILEKKIALAFAKLAKKRGYKGYDRQEGGNPDDDS